MPLKPVDINDLIGKNENVYESIVLLGKRSREINDGGRSAGRTYRGKTRGTARVAQSPRKTQSGSLENRGKQGRRQQKPIRRRCR